jgi:hypothetical protein
MKPISKEQFIEFLVLNTKALIKINRCFGFDSPLFLLYFIILAFQVSIWLLPFAEEIKQAGI